VEGHKFIFVAKTFHVPFKNLKNEMKNAWKICSHVMCAEFKFALGAKPLHDAYQ
jgi:hypothetical protein